MEYDFFFYPGDGLHMNLRGLASFPTGTILANIPFLS